MPDFSATSLYNEQLSYGSVVFGKGAPLLETELNLIQDISSDRIKGIASVLGDCYLEDTVHFRKNEEDNSLIVTFDGFMLLKDVGVIHPQFNFSLPITEGNLTLAVGVKEYTGEDTEVPVYEGATETLESKIIDSRVGKETSRRKLYICNLGICGSGSELVSAGDETLFTGTLGTVSSDGSVDTSSATIKELSGGNLVSYIKNHIEDSTLHHTVDTALSDTSTNPVQNKVVNSALNGKANSSHTHMKSQITDFPTSLPANGGNSATVNGHTVKSDVPENAVFTDTVYDDTDVKEDITDINSNLDTLGKTNLIDKSVRYDGYYANDNKYYNNVSGFYIYVIKVVPNTDIVMSGFSSAGAFCAYLNSQNVEDVKQSAWNIQDNNGTHTIPSDVHYVGICCTTADISADIKAIGFVECANEINDINESLNTLQLGEVAGGKNLANFSKLVAKTTNGITFEYQSNGSIKVSGTVSTDGSVYTPLNLTKIRISKGRWYTSSVKSSNPKSIAKLFFTDNGSITTLQAAETADLYYYIQFFDGVEGKIPAGTVIDEVLYPQIEEGKVVTDYEPYFPSNKMLAEEKADKSETTVNLLKPTLETTTDVNNITYKNNGDGTYTISGTSTTQIVKHIADNIVISQKCVLTGCKGGSPTTYMLGVFDGANYFEVYDIDNAKEIPANTYRYAYIAVRSGVTIPDNTIIKPMITTNLNATIDDFVPYTGDSGSLNGDVADIRSDVDEMDKRVSTQKINIHYGKGRGNDISPVKGTSYIKTPPILVDGMSGTFEDVEESGGGGVKQFDYTYALKGSVKFTVLDTLVNKNTTASGITVKPSTSNIQNGHYYRITGTATEDVTIPLYSVKNPSSDTLYFVSNINRNMSESTFYYLISDASGNTKQFGTEEEKKDTTVFSGHSGEVKVSLVVKSGVKVSFSANVRAGYSGAYSINDRSDKKYSDTEDNVLKSVLDLKTILDEMNKVVLSKSITISSANTNYFLTMLGIGLYYLQAVSSLDGTTYAISHIATVAIGNGMPVIQLDDKTGPMMKFVSMRNPNAPNVDGLGIYSLGAPVTADITIIKIV